MIKDNTKLFFIEEVVSPDTRRIDIISKHTDKVIFKTILQTSDEPNRNGRIYPKDVINNALSQITEDLKDRNFIGELDHPESEDESRLSRVIYKSASHMITKYWWEKNQLWAIVETLYTDQGRNMAALVRDGVKVGFSLRAFGGLEHKNGYDVVTLPIYMVTYDCVSKPSHKISKIQEITQESTNKIIQESAHFDCKDGICKFKPVIQDKINSISMDILKAIR